MDVLARDAQPVERLCRAQIPAEIRPAAGHINIASLQRLTLSAQLRCSARIRQFISGFHLVGAISQRYTYPIDTRLSTRATLSPSDLFSSVRPRFDERAKKTGGENLNPLWVESKDEQLKGWLSDPFLLNISHPVPSMIGRLTSLSASERNRAKS